MSDLNFRAWHRVLGRYLADDEWFMGVHGEPYSGYSDGKFITNWQSDYELDTDIAIEQSTSLKDKNGRKIYEGDIVRIDSMDELRVGYVDLLYDQYCIVCGEDDEGRKIVAEFYYYSKPEENCEIIGNIHENPELLEEE